MRALQSAARRRNIRILLHWLECALHRPRYIRRRAGGWAAVFALAATLASLAYAEPVTVIFETGDTTPFRLGTPIRVRTGLTQLQVGQHLFISAAQGAEFALHELPAGSGTGYLLAVHSNSLKAIDVRAQTVSELQRGLFVLSPASASSAAYSAEGADSDYAIHALPRAGPMDSYLDDRWLHDLASRPGAQLADWVMVRQTDFLRSLTIDTRQLIQNAFFIFRRPSTR